MTTPIPRSAETLRKHAEKTGWTTYVHAATGQWKDRPTELVAVKLLRGDQRAVATWVDGKCASCWQWPIEDHFLGWAQCGYRDLTLAVKAEAGDDRVAE